MSKTKGFLLAVAVAAMAFTFSCSSDDGNGGGNPPGGGSGDSNLVCANGEAWVESGDYEGIIFRSNGEFTYTEAKASNGATWYWDDHEVEGTWSTSGNTLTMTRSGGTARTYDYSVSGNELTMQLTQGAQVYIKTSGIYPVKK